MTGLFSGRAVAAWLVAGVLVSFFVAGPAAAGPDEETLKPIRKQLDKKIEPQFLDAPLSRVLELLQRESGLTIMVDPEIRDEQAKNPVSLEAKEMTIQKTLEWACRASGTDWDLEDGVVFVSSIDRIRRRHISIQLYDVRGLLLLVQNFRAPDLDIDDALSNTTNGGSGKRLSRSAAKESKPSGGGGGVFAADDEETEDVLTRTERAEQILELIRSTVGNPEDWEFFGGELSSVRELNGNLIVRTTKHQHARIAELLASVQKSLGRMVAVEGYFLAVRSDQLERSLERSKGQPVVSSAQADVILTDLLDENRASAKRLATARTVCFNAQRVFVAAANGQVFLSEVMPVPDTVGTSSTLSTARNGMVLDVLPTISFDGKQIAVVIKSDVALRYGMRKAVVPGGRQGAIISRPLGKKDDSPAAVQMANTVVPVEMPEQDLVSHRTTVQIPDGGAVLLTGMSDVFADMKGDTEVVLVLRARIVKARRQATARPGRRTVP